MVAFRNRNVISVSTIFYQAPDSLKSWNIFLNQQTNSFPFCPCPSHQRSYCYMLRSLKDRQVLVQSLINLFKCWEGNVDFIWAMHTPVILWLLLQLEWGPRSQNKDALCFYYSDFHSLLICPISQILNVLCFFWSYPMWLLDSGG